MSFHPHIQWRKVLFPMFHRGFWICFSHLCWQKAAKNASLASGRSISVFRRNIFFIPQRCLSNLPKLHEKLRVVVQSRNFCFCCTKLLLACTRDHSSRRGCGSLRLHSTRPLVHFPGRQSSCEHCSPRSPGKISCDPRVTENFWIVDVGVEKKWSWRKVGVIGHTNLAIHRGFPPNGLLF